MLEEMGLKKAAVLKDADVVVFNTCHIREKAAEKVFSDLGRAYLVKLERAAEGRDTIIGVTGCVVQAEDKEILKRAPYVDFALGPLRYFRLREVVESVFRERERGKGTGQECSGRRAAAFECRAGVFRKKPGRAAERRVCALERRTGTD